MPHAPTLTPSASVGDQLERLVEIMRILRSPDGCPWDREQTVASLRPFVLEEAYEVVDAIDNGNVQALRDELGDFLLEAVFLAQICAEKGSFSLSDSLHVISEKLVRRHPHVFERDSAPENKNVKTPEDVKRRWEEIKAEERHAEGDATGLLAGIPTALPGLLRAYRMGKRAATVGFDWVDGGAVTDKVHEELTELKEAVEGGTPEDVEEELGDLLFTVVNLARHLGVEPESAIRGANQKFAKRFHELERQFAASNRAIADASADELERVWGEVKASETER